MCLVLDVNTFGAFFDQTNSAHGDFRPVLDWVVEGKGKLVYGGTKYKKEMAAVRKFLHFFAGLERAGKLVKVCDKEVDNYEADVTGKETDKDFDDPHLIAIIMASGCKIICTNDKRALPYLKKNVLYQGLVKKPKIYQSKKNSSLLGDQYIASICMPCGKLNKKEISSLGFPRDDG